MSTYFISDIHGEYDLFMQLLKKIKFCEKDTLYICGDIIDKGTDSIKLIKFIANKENIFAIMGNHEYSFSQYIESILETTHLNNLEDIVKKIEDYFPNSIEKLSKQDILYILNLPYYIETDEFICVHAGLEIKDNKIIPIENQDYNYMLFDRRFKNAEFEPINKTILFGHTPCCYDKTNGKFIKTLKDNCNTDNFSSYSKIRLDTGVSYTRMLGVLRKEDMEEIYVKEQSVYNFWYTK